MQKITPFLWFNDKAEEAMHFYASIFKNAKVLGITRYGPDGPGPEGTVMTAEFELDGERFVALNGGPKFTFTPATSFVVNCDTQDEIDYFWDKLSAGGGEKGRCGWLKDKYGLSWQITPSIIPELLLDQSKTQAVMRVVMKMDKLDIATIKRAHAEG